MFYTLRYAHAQDINEEMITILGVVNDFWQKTSIKRQNFHFYWTNGYITWHWSWFNNLSHMFFLFACVNHRNYAIFSLGIKSDIPDKMSHAKYVGYSKVY